MVCVCVCGGGGGGGVERHPLGIEDLPTNQFVSLFSDLFVC